MMTEERSKRREFLPLVFIVNCLKKKPLLHCNDSGFFFHMTFQPDSPKIICLLFILT